MIIKTNGARANTTSLLSQFVQTNEVRELQIDDTLRVNSHFYIPRSYAFYRSLSKIPLIIIFDQQNSANFNQTIQTIDYLSATSNIPQSCILSIGFENGMDRFVLSKYAKDNGSMEKLFVKVNKEIDQLEVDYELDFTEQIVLGHSRSGYMAMQFLFNYPERIYAAISGSSQDISAPHEKEIFQKFLDYLNKNETYRQLYFTAGLESMGDGDELQTVSLIDYFNDHQTPYFHHKGELLPCEHNLSLNFRLQENLTKMYSAYNEILLRSFAAINGGEIHGYDDSKLDQIIQEINTVYSMDLQKDPTYYISLYYAFLNDYRANYSPENRLKNAEGIIHKGMKQFDDHIVFNYHYVYYLLECDHRDLATKYIIDHLSDYQRFKWRDEKLMFKELKAIKELFQE